ncbi:MAG: ATP-binding protein [Nocardiopsaceae bacterium]|nr:ATP-binding protein [Nocardiopsaceae bacterium]
MAALYQAHRCFTGVPRSVKAARDWLRAELAPMVPDERVATAVLLASEAATNSLCHTASGRGGTFTVALVILDRWIHIDIEDGPSGTVPHLAATGLEDEHGRGLALVDALADDWGWSHTGLFFRLALPDPVPQERERRLSDMSMGSRPPTSMLWQGYGSPQQMNG